VREAFKEWRARARDLIRLDIPPEQAFWDSGAQAGLFPGAADSGSADPGERAVCVPPSFLDLARRVSCHADPVWRDLLYRALWRLAAGETHLLALASDPLVRRLALMDAGVRRDAHKAKAFVRFRKVGGGEGEGEDRYIAWHRPDHRVLPLIAPFFKDRFAAMRWTILTPDESLDWDGTDLRFLPGLPRSSAPEGDVLEDLWRAYYRAIFNPARVKVKAMKAEMAVRHWPTLPEASIIPELLAGAPARVAAMVRERRKMDQAAG